MNSVAKGKLDLQRATRNGAIRAGAGTAPVLTKMLLL
jgi:hypothetical protein